MSEDVAPAHPYSPRQPNGMPTAKRSNTSESFGRYDTSQGHELDRTGASGNESDGVNDYYKAHDQNGASKSRGRKKGSKKSSSGWVEAEKDHNNWIHRDKLKEIETKELEEFSMRMGRASRSNSRSQSAARNQSRNQSRGRANSELTDSSMNGNDRNDYHRMISPIPAEDEEEDLRPTPTAWDLRSPAEIEAERDQYSARNNVARPSTSRIPVAKASPHPVPNAFVDRDQPIPRSRHGSGNWDSFAASGARIRSRSGSVSSQLLLDDPSLQVENSKSPSQSNFSTPTSSATNQAQKGKGPNKNNPASRKASGQKLQTKPRNASSGPRNASGTSPVKRPTTSGGAVSRPTTSHRPEGEAPWLATMYKPDPRLPPDQQIIPTHAKRMQQEQWETEGRVGSMYDKEFRLLNTEEFPDKRASISPIDVDQAQQDRTWPLPSPEKRSVSPIDPAVKSPASEQGKFKLTPTIPQSPAFPRAPSRTQEQRPSKVAPPIAPVTPKDSIRLPEPPAEAPQEEKKGCCCIVM